jgi:hypothetical protein
MPHFFNRSIPKRVESIKKIYSGKNHKKKRVQWQNGHLPSKRSKEVLVHQHPKKLVVIL